MSQIDNLISQKIKINGVDVLALEIEADKTDDLRHMADLLRDKMGSGIVVLGSNIEGKASLLAAATKDLKDLFHAGNLIREAAKLVGGGGGGRPDLAQAGGPSPEKLKAALPQIIEMIKEQMKEKN
jgi:alanyl-tRNA synthetase